MSPNTAKRRSPAETRNLEVRRKSKFREQPLRNLSARDRRLFEEFGTGPDVEPSHSCVHYAIEQQARLRPNATAARHCGEQITYGELNSSAQRLANELGRLGIGRQDRVGLYLRRSIGMLVGILGTLKRGAAYVPQDVKHVPDNRLEHVAERAGIDVVLTLSEYREQLPEIDGVTYLEIDKWMATDNPYATPDAQVPSRNPQVQPDDPCFILFTSGTTGEPNGVEVTHGNVANILLTEPGNLGIEPGMKVSQILCISFDMAAWETFSCLAHGGTLIIRGDSIQKAVEKADVVISTPTILQKVDAEKARPVEVAAVAGEPCPRPLAEKWSRFCRFYNSCGPTETTIVNTMKHFRSPDDDITIGSPTPNNTVYILDEDGNPCSIGEVGEMWAGGDCVTAGYITDEVLNQKRYRPDPFLGGDRVMFRTRDLGRWTEDGELEHHGRTDDQVKVRGFRVELDSVSAMLERAPECEQAITLKLDKRHLASFITPGDIDKQDARQMVAENMPYYCIPEPLIAVDEIPTTNRGKVDKDALRKLAKQALADSETDSHKGGDQ